MVECMWLEWLDFVTFLKLPFYLAIFIVYSMLYCIFLSVCFVIHSSAMNYSGLTIQTDFSNSEKNFIKIY